MKKLGLLLLCCTFAAFGFGQEIVAAWTFDNLTGSNIGASNTQKVINSNDEWGAGTLYADGTNGSDDFNNQANPEINSFGGNVLNDPRTTPSASQDLAIVNTSANGKSIVFKFSMEGYSGLQLSYAQRGSATGFSSQTWSYSVDGENFTTVSTITGTNVTTYTLREVIFASSELEDAENVYVKVTFDGCTSGSGNNRIDNVVFRANMSGPDVYPPKVTSLAVQNESTIVLNFNESVAESTAEDAENYSIEGVNFASVAANDNVVTLTTATELAEGLTYTLYVSNVEDLAGNVMAPDTLTFTFGVDQQFHVANIAELREKWTADLDIDATHYGSEVYKLTGNVIITGINNSYRHQIFIQDETGAIVIDDNNNLITSALEVGDEITGIYGSLTDYFGLLQFVVTETFTAPAISIFNNVEPLVVTVQDMADVDYMNNHQCEFLKMEAVKFNETGTFANGQKYTLTQNGQSGNGVWIHFYNIAGLTGEAIPTDFVNLVGPNKISYGSYYLIPRSGDDITDVVGVENYISENDVVIYPNPVADNLFVTIKNDNFHISNAFIYDINGRLVLGSNVEDNSVNMNVAKLSAGQYFLRLSDGNQSVTTKFVKK